MTTERSRGAAAALVGVAGGSLLTYLATRKVQAAPPGVDPAFWDMLQTLTEAIILQTEQINALVAALGGAPAGEDPFANTDSFTTGQVICDVAGQGFQLPSIILPKNKAIVVKALPGNVTWIYLGQIASDSQNLTVSYILVPNEGVGLSVKNADHIWVMALTVNDGIAYIVEQ